MEWHWARHTPLLYSVLNGGGQAIQSVGPTGSIRWRPIECKFIYNSFSLCASNPISTQTISYVLVVSCPALSYIHDRSFAIFFSLIPHVFVNVLISTWNLLHHFFVCKIYLSISNFTFSGLTFPTFVGITLILLYTHFHFSSYYTLWARFINTANLGHIIVSLLRRWFDLGLNQSINSYWAFTECSVLFGLL